MSIKLEIKNCNFRSYLTRLMSKDLAVARIIANLTSKAQSFEDGCAKRIEGDGSFIGTSFLNGKYKRPNERVSGPYYYFELFD